MPKFRFNLRLLKLELSLSFARVNFVHILGIACFLLSDRVTDTIHGGVRGWVRVSVSGSEFERERD